MKTERRHELQTNELANTLAHSIDRVRPYGRLIAGALLAVVMLAVAYGYVTSKSASRTVVGWDEYFRAFYQNDDELLGVTAENYAGTPAGLWARLTLADITLAEGTAKLLTDKAEAKDALDRSASNYLTITREARNDMLLQRARLGLGRTYESLNELDRARKEYRTIIESWPSSAVAINARERLDDLERPATKQFYDWLFSYKPVRAVTRQPGVPGKKPEFDVDALSPDDVKLPSVIGNATGPDLGSPSQPTDKAPDAAGGQAPTVPDASQGDAKKTSPPGEKSPPADEDKTSPTAGGTASPDDGISSPPSEPKAPPAGGKKSASPDAPGEQKPRETPKAPATKP